MADRFNTFIGWLLFAGIVALGLSAISSRYFLADKHHEIEEWGYPIEGAEEEGGADEGPSLPALLAVADPSAGERVFAKCVSCHTIEQGGPNGIGANLYGVVGEEIAAPRGGFEFSSALKDVGGDWTFEKLDEWLKSPRAYAPGTKMSFAGLSKPEDRADVIVYLNSMGSNLPLPEVQEEPAEDEAAAEGEEAETVAEAETEAEEGAEAELEAAPGE